MHWRKKWQPTPVFLPGESQGRGAWWAAVCGVAQSRTRLKRLSSGKAICTDTAVDRHAKRAQENLRLQKKTVFKDKARNQGVKGELLGGDGEIC